MSKHWFDRLLVLMTTACALYLIVRIGVAFL